GWVPEEAATTLADHYRFHREVEHRVQMVNDAQTHLLPKTPDGWSRIAGLMGRDVADVQAELRERLTEVHELTEGFFAPDAQAVENETSDVPDQAVIDRWATYPALRSPRAVEIFERVKPEILQRLAETARPDEALLALDGFLKGLPAGVQLFALFEANTHLIDLLVDIVG
ncbi:MAG: glutamine-synthetase adenylyltransferase, partial [Shimia sp.]|nr:glutamine-synthetase adenylyltransferase [Shimia sp.]